jgi:hypothetical protein
VRDVYAASFYLGRRDVAPADDLALAAATTLAWVAGKYGVEQPSEWRTGEVAFERDRATWRSEEAPGDPRQLWQLDWRQHATDDPGIVWAVRCQIGASPEQSRFTVRIAIDSTDFRLAPARYDVGRPGVIGRLAASPGIHIDGRPLRPVPASVGSDGIPGLVDLLVNPERRLPVIVVTPADGTGRPLVNSLALADRLIGLAHVIEVSARSVTFVLTDRLGPLLSVFGGALRLYWPGFAPDSDPYEHPLWLPPRIEAVEASPRGVVARLEQQLAGVAVVRVGADPLEVELRAARDGAVLARITDLQHEIERIVATPAEPGTEWLEELQRAYDETKGLAEVTARLQRENGDLRAEIDQLRRSFAAYAQSLETPTDDANAPSTPDVVTSGSEAFASAKRHLGNLVIPESAAVSLAELDSANEGPAWGRSAWRAFRALHAYVDEAADFAGFWDWCQRSGRSEAWPATEKKLAMSESETVMNSRELREKRRFEIDSRVDSSGRVVMSAHIKVSEGGGQQAPRIYFYDDTKGPTGKVHVGFFGPHRYVPNKGAN